MSESVIQKNNFQLHLLKEFVNQTKIIIKRMRPKSTGKIQ